MYGSTSYGAIEYSGDIKYSQDFLLSLSETSTLSELAVKSGGKFPVDSSSLSDLWLKSAARLVTDLSGLTDLVALGTSRFMADAFTSLSDTIGFIQARGLEFVELITPTDFIVRVSTRLLSDLHTLSDSLIRSWARLRSLLDSFTGLVDSILIGQSKNKTILDSVEASDLTRRSLTNENLESVSIDDSIAREKRLNRLFAELTSLSDSLVRSIARFSSDVLSAIDRIKKYLNGNIVIDYFYKAKNTLFGDKYSARGTTFTDGYEDKDTVYTSKYNKKDTEY